MVHMGLSSNIMGAPLGIPSMAIVIVILVLISNPGNCNGTVYKTASEWCGGGLENCLVGEQNADSEYLMETEISRMLFAFISFQTFNTNNPDKASVGECNRPPRYDSCLGQKTGISHPENCGPYNRVNPCQA